MTRVICTAFLLGLLISCGGGRAELSKSDKEKIVSDVRSMFDQYHSAIAREGLIGEFKYLDQSEDFFWVPPGYGSALSYDSAKTILEANTKGFQSIEFQWDTLSIIPLSKAIANYSGIVKGVMTDTSGAELEVAIIESGTVIKREDGWKLLSGQSANLTMKSNHQEIPFEQQ